MVKLLDQPDHVSSVASQPVEFPDQNHVAIFHLQLQRVEAQALERTPAHLVGEDAVRFHVLRLECADLAIEGLLDGRYASVAEESHVKNRLLNRLVDTLGIQLFIICRLAIQCALEKGHFRSADNS